ncbi:MAG: glycosyltransferase, partial [bacterium]
MINISYSKYPSFEQVFSLNPSLEKIKPLDKDKYNFIIISFRNVPQSSIELLESLCSNLHVNFVILSFNKLIDTNDKNPKVYVQSITKDIRKIGVSYENFKDLLQALKRGLLLSALHCFKPIILFDKFSFFKWVVGYFLKRWRKLKFYFIDIYKQDKNFFNFLVKKANSIDNFRIQQDLSVYKKVLEKIKIRMNRIDMLQDKRVYDMVFESCKGEPVLSVVTPAFNASKFVENVAKCLNSQTIRDSIEWIVVDDFSNDDTFQITIELVKKYNLNSIILRNRENLGAAYSLKNGFAEAKGKYVAWLSADDFYISKNKLEEDIKILENPKVIVFSKYFVNYNLKTNEFVKIEVPTEKYHDHLYGFEPNYLNGSSVVMKKQDYLDIGGFDEYLANVDADYDLWIRFNFNNYKFGFSETEIFSLIHLNNTSQNVSMMRIGCSLTRSRMWRIFLQKNVKKNISLARLDLPILTYPLFIFDLVMLKILDLSSKVWKRIKFLEEIYDEYLEVLNRLLKTNSFQIY